MKKKEMKRLAERIAKDEHIIQTSGNKDLVYEAENDIIQISNTVSFEDMLEIDELVRELLTEKD